MKYKDTVTRIDKAVKLYKRGLLSLPESFDRCSAYIREHYNSMTDATLDDKTRATDRLYRNALRKLETVLKSRIKHD